MGLPDYDILCIEKRKQGNSADDYQYLICDRHQPSSCNPCRYRKRYLSDAICKTGTACKRGTVCNRSSFRNPFDTFRIVRIRSVRCAVSTEAFTDFRKSYHDDLYSSDDCPYNGRSTPRCSCGLQGRCAGTGSRKTACNTGNC